MRHRIALALIPIIATLGLGTTEMRQPAAMADRPDIVVLMLDDVAPVPRLFQHGMPAANAYLRRGIRFSRYSGNDPLCCPGRAAFLTGQRSEHHGVTRNEATLLDPSMTLATQLHAVGYRTILAGKYLNRVAELEDKTPEGWDASAIMAGAYYDYALWRDGVKERHAALPEDYSTDVLAAHALDMLRDAPRRRPVFLFLTPFATHGDGLQSPHPLAAPRHAGDPRCEDVGYRGGPAFNESDMSDKPAFLAELAPVPYAPGWPLQPACESLLSVDELFSSVRAEMAAQGRTDVLYLLTADNGMAWGQHRWPNKGVPYSTPMPLYVRWEGRDRGPRIVEEDVQNVDLAPTLARLGGTTIGPFPDGRPDPDGMDVGGLLTDPDADLDRVSLLEERSDIDGPLPGWFAVRTTGRHDLGRWHYVEWHDGSRELYDLEADPHELDNVANERSTAGVQARLAAELRSLRWR